jgi:hypothetical protein
MVLGWQFVDEAKGEGCYVAVCTFGIYIVKVQRASCTFIGIFNHIRAYIVILLFS